MISNLLQKVLVSSTVFTVIGFSSIFGAMNSAAALTVESESYKKGNQQDISHIAFFIKDNSGNVTKVKIDGVSGITSFDATNFLNTYYGDSEVVAYQVKASTNKSFVALSEGYSENNLPTEENSADITHNYNKNVSRMTPTEEGGGKPDKENNEDKGGKPGKENNEDKGGKPGKENNENKANNEDNTSDSEEQTTSSQPEEQPAPSEESSSPSPESKFVVAAPSQTNSSSQAVAVPEPGSIAAIAIFGLGGLLRKKKASS